MTITVGTNSYVTLEEARTFALARGITLSPVDATLESQLILAMDYLESKRDEYQGIKTEEVQSLQWPRYGVIIDQYWVYDDVVPQTLKDAQCQLVIEIHNEVDIMPTVTENPIIEEKIDVISVKYSDNPVFFNNLKLTKVDAFLKPLFKMVANGMATHV